MSKSLAQIRSDAKAAGWAQHIRNEADEKAVLAGYYVDLGAAKYVEDFFAQYLRHSKGEWAGKPFLLQDWQREDVIAPLFGWKKPDGRRRFNRGHIELPKKNGKSTLASGLGVYLLVADHEPGAEVYAAATRREQAAIVWTEAANMVDASPQLRAEVQTIRSTHRIVFGTSVFRTFAKEAGGAEGQNIHGLILDELHVWRDRRFFDALWYGGASRRQPMSLAITTAGFDRQSIGWEQHEYAAKVASGAIEDLHFFTYIRGSDSECDWQDPRVWAAANPSMGVTIHEEEFSQACNEAKESVSKLIAFKRYRLNIWTEQKEAWIPDERWQRCAEPVDWKVAKESAGIVTIDLSKRVDLTACAWVAPYRDGFVAKLWFWIPEETLAARIDRDGHRVPYSEWIRSGHLIATPGGVVDYEAIRAHINGLASQGFSVREVAYDPWAATHLATLLGEHDGFHMVEFRQGYKSMSEPSKAFESLVIEKRLYHGGNPVLRWMMSSTAVDVDAAGNIKPNKQKSTDRIDGIIAIIMGIGRLLAEPQAAESVYETRGLLTV